MKSTTSALSSTRLWGWLFIAVIPAMAGVYSLLPPKSFYDTNLAREAGTEADATRLGTILTRDIDRRYAHAWTKDGRHSHFVLPPQVLTVTRAPGPTATLAFLVTSGIETAGSPYATVVAQWFKIDLEHLSVESPALPAEQPAYEVTETGPQGVEETTRHTAIVPLSALFPSWKTRLSGARAIRDISTGPVIKMSSRDSIALANFENAESGDPSVSSGLFTRMLYFSATTITTLGLGDIQPLSEGARILVMAEAVTGIVLAGLFLNALASRRRRAD
jgi:hypothetical protein